MSLFKSFTMGGFECSTHRLKSGRRLDLIASTRHDVFAREDYLRLVDAGLLTARDGFRWHLIERSPGRYDFASVIGMLRAAREVGVQVIWDLHHYGWPDDIDIFSAAFVDRFAAFAKAAAELIAEESRSTPLIVPINEISFFSWAAGDHALFNPFARGRGDELKAQLVRATIAAIDAIREVTPGARFVHTDPMIHVIPSRDPRSVEGAAEQRASQFDALDMLTGRLLPELGGRPEYLDIIGVNYYIHNQWVWPGGHGKMIEPSHRDYVHPAQLLKEYHERYRRPIFIAETGIEEEARPAWLRYMRRQAAEAIRTGVPLEGLCLYPIVNHPGWDDDRHCHNGLWDYADAAGRREACAPLLRELERQVRSEILLEAEGQMDERELDHAAHVMEDRSRRDDP